MGAYLVVFSDGRYLGEANVRHRDIGRASMLTKSEADRRASGCGGKVVEFTWDLYEKEKAKLANTKVDAARNWVREKNR